jgi:hypothetical protein
VWRAGYLLAAVATRGRGQRSNVFGLVIYTAPQSKTLEALESRPEMSQDLGSSRGFCGVI